MDVRMIDKEIVNDGSCGGYKHCRDKEFDNNTKDCQDCLKDYFQSIEMVEDIIRKGEI